MYKRFVPDIYQHSVLDINYNKLKEHGIKCILFDLDNTLLDINSDKLDRKIQNLLVKLSKEFKIIVVSNNFKKRIKPICDIINIDFISFCLKPLTIKFKPLLKKENFSLNEICIIGDQLISDILVGKKLKITTILVEPLSPKDLKITKVNRLLETKIFKELTKLKLLERGRYYE
jgi:HAD superfamily phosphatase (TIGR01668 family)